MGFRMRAVALTALVLLLAGCVQNEPTVTARPPAADPVFASDEEALAAAVEAYERYLMVQNSVLQDGGADAQRFSTVVTTDRLEKDMASAGRYAQAGYRQVGETVLRDSELQAYFGGNVTIYACTDWTATEVVDKQGNSVTPDGAPDLLLMEVQLVSSEAEGHLLINEAEAWFDSPMC